ncbi:MAG: DNA polymerase [Mogibacterium sp.]|nr:DNA polymerase [Mogibacterium sp.]MBR4090058.1 DNA polymerase [Mogibacterium sp.]
MKTCSIDVETYSSVDLGACGLHKYMESDDFEILLIGYSFDGSPVRVHDCTQPGCWPRDLLEALTDPAVTKTAFNAAFERNAFARTLGEEMPPEQWSDTMIMALEMGLPGSLAGAGAALGLPEDQLKDPIGKSLIQYFSKPCRPTKANGGRTRNLPQHDPEKWKLYIEYNRQDVVTEMAIRKKLLPLVDSEQALWCLDQRMNDHGVRIDLPMVRKIVDFDTGKRAELAQEAKDLTGLDNPNSLAQLKPWLTGRGVPVETLRKDDLDTLLGQDLPTDVRRVLEIRKALGKTSTAKYGTMLEATCADGRLRGILQFYGANRSGRWAGRIVQTHNLARNSLPDLDLARQLTAQGDFETLETLFGEPAFVFSELVRTAFIPSPGCRFCVSDFSAIEARVIAWIAGEQWVLDAFRAGKDIYCETASMMYHVPVVKHGVNGELRQKGKIATLACGYQGGVGAMKAMDSSGSIPEEEMQSIVDHWRQANPMIVKLWRDYEQSAKTAIKERRTVKRGIRVPADNLDEREHMAGGPVRPYSVREGVRVEFSYKNGNLLVRLPSGRRLCYYHARVRQDGWKESITYMGVNQTTKQWQEVETYGGKIVENIVQATARDCLAEAMQRVAAMGYQIVMHVHDEMIVDVPVEDKDALARINRAMSDPISWAPGLPLRGDGYETTFYKKD